MKKLNGSYIILVFGLLLIGVLATLQQEQQNYQETWYSKSKQPFGGYALQQFLASYTQNTPSLVYEPLQKVAQKQGLQGTVLLVGHSMGLSPDDWAALKKHLSQGNTALIATYSLPQFLQDTLALEVEAFNAQWLRSNTLQELLDKELSLRFTFGKNYPRKGERVSAKAANWQFTQAQSETYPTATLAVNESAKPVVKRYAIGQGQLIVSANPLLLSNYFLMQNGPRIFSQGLFSLLPKGPLQHFEYYQVGALKSGSPLRSLLSFPALKAALWVSIFGLLTLFILGSKRRQRAIPSLQPPSNASLNFVKTLAALHYSTKNYQSLYYKRLNFLKDYVYQHYRIRLKADDELCWQNLAAKSNAEPKQIEALRQLLKPNRSQVSQAQLNYQEEVLTLFYTQAP